SALPTQPLKQEQQEIKTNTATWKEHCSNHAAVSVNHVSTHSVNYVSTDHRIDADGGDWVAVADRTGNNACEGVGGGRRGLDPAEPPHQRRSLLQRLGADREAGALSDRGVDRIDAVRQPVRVWSDPHRLNSCVAVTVSALAKLVVRLARQLDLPRVARTCWRGGQHIGDPRPIRGRRLDVHGAPLLLEMAGDHGLEHLMLHRLRTGAVRPGPVGEMTQPQTRGPRIHLLAGDAVDQGVGMRPGDVDATLPLCVLQQRGNYR